MKISTMNVILWLSIIWMPLLFYVILCNETRFKKNIVIGVTFPQEAREDETLQQLLSVFKKRLLFVCIGLIVIAIPCIFIPKTGMAMTVWMIWILFAMIAPYVPYVQCHLKLKQLKEERGWRKTSSAATVVDLSAASRQTKWLSPYLFALPLLVSLLPMLFDRDMTLLYLIDAGMVLFCWLGYRYLYRNKSEVVDDNVAVTEALTRIRRYNWGKIWLLAAWFMAALNLIAWLTKMNSTLSLYGILLLSAILIVASISIELKLRRLQETLTAQSGTDFYVDDDDKWIWGMFYYDPNDKRLIVNNRVGMNTTVNLAKRSGQIFMGVMALLLLLMPFLGVWLDHLESTPVDLDITDTAIVAIHTDIEYELPLEDIAVVEYLTERPNMSRTSGTGMNTVLKGNFSTPWGPSKVCLDPRTGPYLHIVTKEKKHYLFGSADGSDTEAVYQQLEVQLNNETLK